jgi:hypothetical protein
MMDLEKSEDQKMSVGILSSNEDKAATSESNHLPEIREDSSKNSSTNFELSPSKDDFGNSQKLGNVKQSPMVSIVQTSRDKYQENSLKGDDTKYNTNFPVNINKSSSVHTLLMSSRRNPCEMANEPSMHIYNKSKEIVGVKGSVGDRTSDGHTQLNLGSPVLNKQQVKPEKIVSSKPKRPSSAGDRHNIEYDEPLRLNLLASTVGISRKGVKLNLASMIFSKPEVESNYVHSEKFISRGTSRVSSARGDNKTKAIILIQKRLRGYCTRVRVSKQIELKDYLENKLDFDDNEKVGQGLKMSDLSMSPGSNFKMVNVKRNQMLIDTNMISELKYNPAESKLENSQSILIDFFNKNGAKNANTSNMLYIENTCRNYNNEDERDLNKNVMNLHMHDSPLTRILPEDEISIISSRIETNRKGAHNTTFEILNSTRKNKLKDESVKIVESIKKNSISKTLFSKTKKNTMSKTPHHIILESTWI